MVALIVQYTKFILAFKYLAELFFLPQLFTHKQIVFPCKLFKRYIDFFPSIDSICELIMMAGNNFLDATQKILSDTF